MPSSPEEIQKIIRDPEFQALSNNPESQVRVIQDYLYQKEEQFGSLPLDEQISTAAKVLDYHKPGIISRVANVLPIIGPIKQAVESPDQVRPLTRSVLKGIGAEGILSTGLGRGLAEAGREIVEGAALIPLGSAIAKPIIGLAGKVLGGVAARTLGGVAIQEATTGAIEAAAPLAKSFATRAFIERAVDRAVTDGTIGALYGAVSAAEHGDNPLNHLGESALYGAALGVAFMGFGAAARRFGEYRARQAVELLQTSPEMQTILKDAAPILQAFSKTAKVGREEAGDVISRALQGVVRDEEFPLLRQTMLDNPSLLKTDMGLKIMQNQKELLLPKVLDPLDTGQLEIAIEGANGRRYTTIAPGNRDVAEIISGVGTGELHVEGAKGRGAPEFIQRVQETLDARPIEGAEPNPQLPLEIKPGNTRQPEVTPGPAQGNLFAPRLGDESYRPAQAPLPYGAPGPAGSQIELPFDEGVGIFRKAIGGEGLSEQESFMFSDQVRQIVQEQISSTLPQELRELENIQTRPGPVRSPGTTPTSPSQLPVLSREEMRLFGKQGPAVLNMIETARTSGEPLSTLKISGVLDVPLSQASTVYRKLVETGRIDKRGNPLETAAPVTPREPAPKPVANPGSPTPIPGTSELGTVVQDTPALRVVEKASGEQVSVVELATGEEATMVKRPGLPDAPAIAPTTTSTYKGYSIDEMGGLGYKVRGPNGEEITASSLEGAKARIDRLLGATEARPAPSPLETDLPLPGYNPSKEVFTPSPLQQAQIALQSARRKFHEIPAEQEAAKRQALREVSAAEDAVVTASNAAKGQGRELSIPEMTPQQRLSQLERIEAKMRRGEISNDERRTMQALRQYETEGRLDPRFNSVRCRP